MAASEPHSWILPLALETAAAAGYKPGGRGTHVCRAPGVPDAWLHGSWEEGDALLFPFGRLGQQGSERPRDLLTVMRCRPPSVWGGESWGWEFGPKSLQASWSHG